MLVVRKMKPEDAQDHASTPERQKPKAVPQVQDRSSNKRRHGEKEGGQSHAKRRKTEKGVDVLMLRVEAERVSNVERDVVEYSRIDVQEGNLVEGNVHGQSCTIVLDSGSAVSCLMESLARALGLVTGQETRVERLFNMWCGEKWLRVVELAEVVVTLQGGVQVNTPVVVFPDDMDDPYPHDDLTLAMSRLQEGGMLQVFRPRGTSTLFIRHPERLLRRCEPQHKWDVYTFAALTSHTEEPLTVLVDTGALNCFYITHTGLQKVAHQCLLPPRRVLLDFGLGARTVVEVTTVQVCDFDFVLGTRLLCQCSAIMNYIDLSLTLRVGRRHLRLHLQSRSPPSLTPSLSLH